jgi:hypothetical protein
MVSVWGVPPADGGQMRGFWEIERDVGADNEIVDDGWGVTVTNCDASHAKLAC